MISTITLNDHTERTPVVLMRERNTRTMGIIELQQGPVETSRELCEDIGKWFLRSLDTIGNKCVEDNVEPDIKLVLLGLNEKQLRGLYRATVRQCLKNS